MAVTATTVATRPVEPLRGTAGTMLNEVLAAARSCDLDVVVPEVVSDDPSTVRDLVAQAAGSFIEEGPHDSRG